MKRLARAEGFTIIEALIVLAVTGAMFLIAMLAFNGQQEKTRVNQSARDLESKVQDVANDISAGYFPDNSEFSCNGQGARPVFTSGGSEGQGTNNGCIFLGKAIQFTGCEGGCDTLQIYTVAGRRQANGQEVTELEQAQPVIAPEAYNDPYALKNGMQIERVVGEGGTDIAGVAFYTSLAGVDAQGDLVAGSQSTSMYAVPTGGTFTTQVERVRETDGRINTATLCLSSDPGNADAQVATLRITDNAAGITTNLRMGEACDA